MRDRTQSGQAKDRRPTGPYPSADFYGQRRRPALDQRAVACLSTAAILQQTAATAADQRTVHDAVVIDACVLLGARSGPRYAW